MTLGLLSVILIIGATPRRYTALQKRYSKTTDGRPFHTRSSGSGSFGLAITSLWSFAMRCRHALCPCTKQDGYKEHENAGHYGIAHQRVSHSILHACQKKRVSGSFVTCPKNVRKALDGIWTRDLYLTKVTLYQAELPRLSRKTARGFD